MPPLIYIAETPFGHAPTTVSLCRREYPAPAQRVIELRGVSMIVPDSYHHRQESGNAVLQAHMQSTTQTVRVIEMRRQTIYSAYAARDCPPSLDLALGTLASVATLSRVVGGHTAEMVAIARKAGASWSQIGEALGVSKQAAHKQFRQPPTAAAPVAAVSAPRIRSMGRPEENLPAR